MPSILVLGDDASTRDALVDALRALFPRARVVAMPVDAAPEAVEREGATIVLADMTAVEGVLRRRRSRAGARVVALTRAMGPDTLMKAEALGVDASLRAPVSPRQLQAVLGPMLDGAAADERNAEG